MSAKSKNQELRASKASQTNSEREPTTAPATKQSAVAEGIERKGSGKRRRRRPDVNLEAEFLLVEEVALLLRTTVKAIRCAIDKNDLAGVRRERGRILVKRSELLASIEGSCASSSRKARQ